MKNALFLALLASASPAAAAIVSAPECSPELLNPAENEIILYRCRAMTNDAGRFETVISSGTTQMRLTAAGGSLRVADRPGVVTAFQAAYRARIVALRAERVADEQRRQRLATASERFTPAEVE